jgi:hypothetical protein
VPGGAESACTSTSPPLAAAAGTADRGVPDAGADVDADVDADAGVAGAPAARRQPAARVAAAGP